MKCGWCKIHLDEVKKWREMALKFHQQLKTQEALLAQIESEKAMNAELTEEVEKLKEYEWMYKDLCK